MKRLAEAIFLLLASFAVLSGMVMAQENPVTNSASNSQVAEIPANEIGEDSNRIPVDAAQLAAEKRKKATAGLAAVGGIAILGVGAIAIIMVWARRLRRLARNLGPTQKTAGNDFWFLKPSRLIVDNSQANKSVPPPDSQPPTETPNGGTSE